MSLNREISLQYWLYGDFIVFVFTKNKSKMYINGKLKENVNIVVNNTLVDGLYEFLKDSPGVKSLEKYKHKISKKKVKKNYKKNKGKHVFG